MKKLFTFFTCFCIFSFAAAQTSKITGAIVDPGDKKPVQYAVVAVLTPKDSILHRFTRTDAEGKFTLQDVKPVNYILMTTHPHFVDLMDDIQVTGDLDLNEIAVLSKVKLLQEVIIKTGSPIKIKGDTTVYTADSFKVSAN